MPNDQPTPDALTYRPALDELAYTFGGRDPVDRIMPGQLVRVRTEDCFGGAVLTVDDLPSKVCNFPYLNPVSGPFHVVGASPGDTLAIHIISLTPASDRGFSSTFPHFGALTSTPHTATLQPPLEERVWRYEVDVDAGTVRYRARRSDYTVDLALSPMLGTVGVAPAADEVRMTIVPGAHGGNIDTPQLKAGSTLYLGVNVPGAHLALGDGHARQGDGEAGGVAVEIPMDVVFAVEVISGVYTPWPRLETDTHLMSIGLARPLEDAYRMSHCDLVGWVQNLTGLDTLDAYQLVSQTSEASTGNVCDLNYSMLAGISKAHLGLPRPYADAHARLRAAGPL